MQAAAKLSAALARHAKLLALSGLALFTYFAAIVRMQPLLWAFAALLSATLIVGALWPHWLVRRLSVTRSGPARAMEDDTVTLHVEVRNHGWLPRFMIELVDYLPFAGVSAGSANAVDAILDVVSYIPGRGQYSFDASLLCEKRGLYRLGPVRITSSFPLGVAHAVRHGNGGIQELIVYPNVFPIASLPLTGVPSEMHRGDYRLSRGAGAAEFSGLRAYQRGDNPRHIHWLATARLNELMVKEFEPQALGRLYLVLDLAADANVGQGKHSTLEYAIRIAASMASLSCGNGISTRLLGRLEHSEEVEAGSGFLHYQNILDELAILDSHGTTPYAARLEGLSAQCRYGETVAVFLSEPDERRDDTLRALSLLHTRGVNLLVVDFERESFFVVDDAHVARRSKQTRQKGARAWTPEMIGHWLQVRRGDELLNLFNQ